MPELPEVEAARAAISDNCAGKKIVRAIIADDTKVIDGVSRTQLESSLLGKTIVAAHRKGKNLWITLDSPPFPSFQFGMTGAVYIKGVAVTKYKRSAVKDADEWPSKFSKFFIELDDGLEMSFTDKRRFAKVRLLEDPASVPPISELGPDALLKPVNEKDFFISLSKKKIAIKSLLLDQSFISGIGNWIADEVLYQARIHPSQSASSVSQEHSSRLLKCINEVVQHAVEVDADSCLFPFDWLFHSRWGKKPGKLDGKKIDFISVGGRTSAYVPELQKLIGEQPTKAPAKSRKQASKKTKEIDDNHDIDSDENEVSEDSGGKQTKNRKAGAEKLQSKDDEEVKTATRTSARTSAAVKRKPQQRNEDGGKKAKKDSNSRKDESDASDNGTDSKDGDQKKAVKSKATKPQAQTKRKTK